MARWLVAAKAATGALGVYASTRLLYRLAKYGTLAALASTLLFYRELLLSLGANDALTGAVLGVVYSTPPSRPPSSKGLVRLRVRPQRARVLTQPLLGFAIDTSQVVGGRWWSPQAEVEVGRGAQKTRPFDFGRDRLLRLARALGPARVRIGGTEADHVYYNEEAVSDSELPPGYELTFTRKNWDDIAAFTRSVGYSLLFTVNAGPGPRDERGAWQAGNATRLLAFAEQNPAGDVVWELGNEVNAYWFIHGWSHRVNGVQYAADFRRFEQRVHEHFPGARVAGPAGFVWPVTGEPFSSTLGIFEDFLKTAGADADIVTWHYYPQQSRRCPLATRRASEGTLLHPGFLDETATHAAELQSLVRRYAPRAELWLGETGNAQCGGEPGVSDRFASSLWYLDQLGAMSRLGQPMIRQTLVGSHYGMLEPESLDPRPDYWAALLARRLLSRRILAPERLGTNPYLRAYATCTSPSAGFAPGSVSYWFINLNPSEPARVAMDANTKSVAWYRVTARSLDSASVMLNGATLAWNGEALPVLQGVVSAVPANGEHQIAPQSYAFAVVDAEHPACFE